MRYTALKIRAVVITNQFPISSRYFSMGDVNSNFGASDIFSAPDGTPHDPQRDARSITYGSDPRARLLFICMVILALGSKVSEFPAQKTILFEVGE